MYGRSEDRRAARAWLVAERQVADAERQVATPGDTRELGASAALMLAHPALGGAPSLPAGEPGDRSGRQK